MSVQKAAGCMGVTLLCALLFVVGIGIVIGGITLASAYLLPPQAPAYVAPNYGKPGYPGGRPKP